MHINKKAFYTHTPSTFIVAALHDFKVISNSKIIKWNTALTCPQMQARFQAMSDSIITKVRVSGYETFILEMCNMYECS